jgi:ABC-2 type transport system ATP-binding protein
VLVLDEPGNGLDPQGIRWLRDLLRARSVKGHTVFVSSHLLAEVEHLADDVVVINRGRLITAGALAQLQQAGIAVRTPSPQLLARILRAAGGVVDVRGNGALLVRGLSTAEIGNHACAAGIALHELAARSGSLEELFLSWTGNDTPAGPSRTGTPKEVVGQ